MKAIHKSTKQEYQVSEIIGEYVVLESPRSGNKKRIAYKLFKKQYNLKEGGVTIPENINKELEFKEAGELAKEVLMESNSNNNKDITKSRAPKRSTNTSEKSKSISKEAKKGRGLKQPTKEVTMQTLQNICKELNIEPGKARRTLRKHNIERTSGRWEWSDPKILKQVRELLQ